MPMSSLKSTTLYPCSSVKCRFQGYPHCTLKRWSFSVDVWNLHPTTSSLLFLWYTPDTISCTRCKAQDQLLGLFQSCTNSQHSNLQCTKLRLHTDNMEDGVYLWYIPVTGNLGWFVGPLPAAVLCHALCTHHKIVWPSQLLIRDWKFKTRQK